MSLSLPRPFFFLLLACFLMIGCGGGSGVNVKGKLFKGGQPIKVSEKGMVQVRFIGEKGTFSGNVTPEGTFLITANEGKGIPTGTYKIAVFAYDPYPTKDLLGGKFDEQKTTISRDIKSGEEVVIDVDKP
jgi:hypothetical protein